jgi:hypothetical protein
MRITVLGAGTLALGMALAAGCTKDSESDDSATAGCTALLDVYCNEDDPCPDYEQSTDDAQHAAESCGEFFDTAATGTCGSHLYVQIAHWGGGRIEYFDTEGELVGATVTTDANGFCDGRSPSIDYGLVPDCQRRPQLVLCDADGAGGAGGAGGNAGSNASTSGAGNSLAGGAGGAG